MLSMKAKRYRKVRQFTQIHKAIKVETQKLSVFSQGSNHLVPFCPKNLLIHSVISKHILNAIEHSL